MALMLPPTSIVVDSEDNDTSLLDENHHSRCSTPDPMPLSSPTVSRVTRQPPLGDISAQHNNRQNTSNGNIMNHSSYDRAEQHILSKDISTTNRTKSLSAYSTQSTPEINVENGRRGRWTFKDDQKLRRLVLEYGEDWSYISTQMSGRTVLQCQRRWNHVVRHYSDNNNNSNSLAGSCQMKTSTATSLPTILPKTRRLSDAASVSSGRELTPILSAASTRCNGNVLGASKSRISGSVSTTGESRLSQRRRQLQQHQQQQQQRALRADLMSSSVDVDTAVPAGLFRRADEFLASQLVKMREDGATRRLNDAVPVAPSGTLATLNAQVANLMSKQQQQQSSTHSIGQSSTAKLSKLAETKQATRRNALGSTTSQNNHLPTNANHAAQLAFPPVYKAKSVHATSASMDMSQLNDKSITSSGQAHSIKLPPIGIFSRSGSDVRIDESDMTERQLLEYERNKKNRATRGKSHDGLLLPSAMTSPRSNTHRTYVATPTSNTAMSDRRILSSPVRGSSTSTASRTHGNKRTKHMHDLRSKSARPRSLLPSLDRTTTHDYCFSDDVTTATATNKADDMTMEQFNNMAMNRKRTWTHDDDIMAIMTDPDQRYNNDELSEPFEPCMFSDMPDEFLDPTSATQLIDDPSATNSNTLLIDGYLLDRDTVYAAVANDLFDRGDIQLGSSTWDIMGRVISKVMEARERRNQQNGMSLLSSHPTETTPIMTPATVAAATTIPVTTLPVSTSLMSIDDPSSNPADAITAASITALSNTLNTPLDFLTALGLAPATADMLKSMDPDNMSTATDPAQLPLEQETTIDEHNQATTPFKHQAHTDLMLTEGMMKPPIISDMIPLLGVDNSNTNNSNTNNETSTALLNLLASMTNMSAPAINTIDFSGLTTVDANNDGDRQTNGLSQESPLPQLDPMANPFYLGDVGGIDDDLSQYILSQSSINASHAISQSSTIHTNHIDCDDLDETTDDIVDTVQSTHSGPLRILPKLTASMSAPITSTNDDPESAEYMRFLESLVMANDSAVASQEQQQLLDDGDDDCEFTADANLLKDQSEELRWDRNAIISKREYQDLVMDTDSDDENITAAGRVKPGASYARADNYLFTTDQLQLLRQQQENNLQLLLQTYTVERQVRGEIGNEMLNHWRRQIISLVRLREEAIGTPATPTTDERMVSFPSLHDIVGLNMALEWISSPLSQGPDDLQFVRDMGRPVRRRRRIPISNEGEKAQFFWEVHENKPLSLPASLRELNQAFAPIFDKALIPQIVCANTRARTSFFPAQDALLLIGLHAFGDDWHSIRSHLLPNMTAKQLATRFNNLKSRRYPSNPVKDWHLMRVKALSLEEEEKLRKGVAHFGRKFKLLNARVLRNRPPMLLRQAWREMYPQYPFRKVTTIQNNNSNNNCQDTLSQTSDINKS